MLTPYDDFPVHQTADPITQPSTGDPNHYDRYFFNGYEENGEFFLGAAMGHYPNRNVIDAAFSIVYDGVEHSVFASGAMPRDRSTQIGPVRIEVVEPLRALRVIVSANDHGIEADVTFRARTVAIEEPRQKIVRSSRLLMDYTRLTQWGTWEGEVDVYGTRVRVDPSRTYGTRDRSWGIRGVGQQVPTNFPPSMTQVFWLWAPLNFDDVCTHLALFEHADGNRWLESALLLPVLSSPEAPTWGDESGIEHMTGSEYRLQWQEGRREMASAGITMRRAGGESLDVEFEPLYTFRMRGIGYTHPHWGHGSVHGPLAIGGESIPLDEFDPEDFSSIHIQTLCKVRMGERNGVGILEQLAIGPHEPTGLTGLFDGYRPAS